MPTSPMVNPKSPRNVTTERDPPLAVLMGVAGSGKTTVGRLVAAALRVPFVDGDDFHPAANVLAMHAGVPLDDAARRPWGERLHLELQARRATGAVLACSALRTSFRHHLRDGLPHLQFFLLQVPAAELHRRLVQRQDHFAGPELLPSQLDALQLDAGLVVVDGDRPALVVAADIVDLVRGDRGRAPADPDVCA
jgi:gluconokinase